MKINRIVKLKNNTYQVDFESESICLCEEVLLKYDLLIQKQVSPKVLKEIKRENEFVLCYRKALSFLDKKMRTKKELSDFLRDENVGDEEILLVLERLEANGYIDDVKYASEFLNRCLKTTLDGPRKIKMKLENLGITSDILFPLFDEVDESVWVDRIIRIRDKREQSDHISSEKAFKEKLCKYLVNLGYPRDLVQDEIDDLNFERDKDIVIGQYKKWKTRFEKKYSGHELEFYIKNKLAQLGFSSEEINEAIENYEG